MRMRWLAAGLVTGALGIVGSAPATATTHTADVALDRLATMRVDGAITIGADGAPTDYRITTAVSDAQRAALTRLVDGWRFRVVSTDQAPAPATGNMRITLSARQAAEGLHVGVDEVQFLAPKAAGERGAEAELPPGWIAVDGALASPVYPPAYLAAKVTALVNLVLRIGVDGKVRDVAVWRTTLFAVRGDDAQMHRAIDAFERATVRRARTWKFVARLRPGQSPDVDFVVGVPVRYRLSTQAQETTGEWHSEIRSQPRLPDWATARSDAPSHAVADSFGVGDDAEDDRIRLITPVNGNPVM